MTESAIERSLHAQQASLEHWSRVEDRTDATQAWRDAFTRKLELQIDPDGKLPPQELAVRVEMAKKAHMVKMTRRSIQARRARAEAKKPQ